MTITLAPAPGTRAPWMQAMEAQLAGVDLIERAFKSTAPELQRLRVQWEIDRVLMKHAIPFAWSAETVAACLAASRSVPHDAAFTSWNLNTNAAWWYFDTPLPFQTINRVLTSDEPDETAIGTGIKAICMGWINTRPTSFIIPAGSPIELMERALQDGPPVERSLGICAWLEDPLKMFPMIPSQTMLWEEDETLCDALVRVRTHHEALYGPGGKFVNEPQVGLDVFMGAAEGMARFLLAGLAWLDQKVLLEADGHVERHRRKAFNRSTGQTLTSVKVISLRRTQRTKTVEPGEEKREYSCRWEVDGHWRNQPCGPKRGDRKLTWINPFMKGPDDKPLRIPRQKVYVVKR